MVSDFRRGTIIWVFAAMDADGDGYLSRSEFTGHWTEFWAGDDPAAAGSWGFGSFPVGVGHD